MNQPILSDCTAHQKRKREIQRKWYANLTSEQLAKKRNSRRQWYANLTPEQKKSVQKQQRAWYASLSPEKLEKRREQMRERKRRNLTSEQKKRRQEWKQKWYSNRDLYPVDSHHGARDGEIETVLPPPPQIYPDTTRLAACPHGSYAGECPVCERIERESGRIQN